MFRIGGGPSFEDFSGWQRNQQGLNTEGQNGNIIPGKPAAPAMPTGGKGPTTQVSVAPPFTPEQTPAQLPPLGQQASITGINTNDVMNAIAPIFQNATKGASKGPTGMQQTMPMQAGPGNLNGANTQAGSNRPMDLQALIQGLMSSGLLGGL